MKISVVMPVHNEEEYLPYSLASLENASIDELIVVLDRCTDKSSRLVKQFKPCFNVEVIEKTWQNWEYPTGEVFETGFQAACGHIIYTMAADIYIDKTIYQMTDLFMSYDVVSFYYQNHDLHHNLFQQIHQEYLNFLKRCVPTLKSFQELGKRTGIFGVKREVWKKLHWQDVPSPDTQFFIDLREYGAKHKYVSNVNNLHLRVGLRKDRQFLQGLSRASHNVHWLKVLLHSLVYVKPYVFTAYTIGKHCGTFAKEELPHV